MSKNIRTDLAMVFLEAIPYRRLLVRYHARVLPDGRWKSRFGWQNYYRYN